MFRRLTRVAKGRARIFLKIGLAGFEQLFSVEAWPSAMRHVPSALWASASCHGRSG